MFTDLKHTRNKSFVAFCNDYEVSEDMFMMAQKRNANIFSGDNLHVGFGFINHRLDYWNLSVAHKRAFLINFILVNGLRTHGHWVYFCPCTKAYEWKEGEQPKTFCLKESCRLIECKCYGLMGEVGNLMNYVYFLALFKSGVKATLSNPLFSIIFMIFEICIKLTNWFGVSCMPLRNFNAFSVFLQIQNFQNSSFTREFVALLLQPFCAMYLV